jgi:hypothetical protein
MLTAFFLNGYNIMKWEPGSNRLKLSFDKFQTSCIHFTYFWIK